MMNSPQEKNNSFDPYRLNIWSFKAVREALNVSGSKLLNVSSGLCASGVLHWGSVRELVIADYIRWISLNAFQVNTMAYCMISDMDPNKSGVNKGLAYKDLNISTFNNSLRLCVDKLRLNINEVRLSSMYHKGYLVPYIKKISDNIGIVKGIVQQHVDWKEHHIVSIYRPNQTYLHVDNSELEGLLSSKNLEEVNNFKLGFRYEWAALWDIFNIHYESYGSDLIPCRQSSEEIFQYVYDRPNLLKGKPYELFLTGGHKMSKRKSHVQTYPSWEKLPAWLVSYICIEKPWQSSELSYHSLLQCLDKILSHIKHWGSYSILDKYASTLPYVLRDYNINEIKIPKTTTAQKMLQDLIYSIPLKNIDLFERQRIWDVVSSKYDLVKSNTFHVELFNLLLDSYTHMLSVAKREPVASSIYGLRLIHRLLTSNMNAKTIQNTIVKQKYVGLWYSAIYHSHMGPNIAEAIESFRSFLEIKVGQVINSEYCLLI